MRNTVPTQLGYGKEEAYDVDDYFKKTFDKILEIALEQSIL